MNEIEKMLNLREENQRLKEQLKLYEFKEQLKLYEFKEDIVSIYIYTWSENTCIEAYCEESGLFRALKTGDVSSAELHNLYLKYGYEYVNNYFKRKHDEWAKTQENKNENEEEGE